MSHHQSNPNSRAVAAPGHVEETDVDANIANSETPLAELLTHKNAAVRRRAQRGVVLHLQTQHAGNRQSTKWHGKHHQCTDCFSDEQTAAAEAAAMSCHDGRLDAEERVLAAHIGALLAARCDGDQSAKFAHAWGQRLISLIETTVTDSNAATLAAAALSALTLAAGLAEGELTTPTGESVGLALQQQVKPPMKDAALLSAYIRCVAATLTEEHSLGQLDSLVRTGLAHDDVDVVIAALDAVGFVAERFPDATSLSADDLAQLSQGSPKNTGKAGKKELYAELRRAEAALQDQDAGGSKPVEVVQLFLAPAEGGNIMAKQEVVGYNAIELLRCLRGVAGNDTADFLLVFPTIRAAFGVTATQPDSVADAKHSQRIDEREEAHDRAVAGKQRDQGRQGARDRKAHAADHKE
jgi:hypothetical protein